jgi:adenylate cyclase
MFVDHMKKSPEIEAVTRRFLASRINNDMEAMNSLHSASEYLRLIGSDRDEWLVGRDAVLPTGSGQESSEAFAVADSKILRIEAFEDGDFGWAAVEQERTLVQGQTFTMRLTIVFRIEASVWRIVQLHFSIPVSDKEVLGVDLTHTLSDLLASIDSEPGRSELNGDNLVSATVMFTDVVGSTALSQTLGDEDWSDLISAHFREVQQVVERESGSVIKTLGDGGMYVFASGTSALIAAIDIQKLLAVTDSELGLRIGVHSGDVMQSRDDYLGMTVNKAARVAAAAERGQILVSGTTADMVNTGRFHFEDPITAQLKGIDGIHTLRPLMWESDTAR